jgi:hypothetical protein
MEVRFGIDVVVHVAGFDDVEEVDLCFDGFDGRQEAGGTDRQHGE